MKRKITLFVILCLFSCQTFCQSPDWLFAKSIGGTGADIGYAIATDSAGNIYTTGSFTGTVDFDPGPGIFNLTSAGNTDIFISKLDASGNFVWAKVIGGTGPEVGYALTVDDSGNVFITGKFSTATDFDPGPGIFNLSGSGAFICKLDSSGNFVWANKIMGSATGYAIALDSFGNVYIAGGGSGSFTSKSDNSGNTLWVKSITATAGYAITINQLGNGDVYVTGTFIGTTDFDPDTSVGHVFIMSPISGTAIFISKSDSAGNFIWAKEITGGAPLAYVHSIALDASCNVYTAGYFYGGLDFDPGVGTFNLGSSTYTTFISKLDSSGNFIWAKAMGGNLDDYCYSMVLAPGGSKDIYTTGGFAGTMDFDPGTGIFNLTATGIRDIFICKLDSSGNFKWAKAATGGTVDDVGYAIATNAFGNVYTTGFFNSSSVSFGTTVLTNASTGTSDLFISKLTSTCSAYFTLSPDISPHTYWAVNNASGTPPLSYDWDWGDGSPHDNIPYPSHTYATAGFYTICLSISDASGCSSAYCDTFTLARMDITNTMIYVNVVNSIPTIVQENQQPIVSLYPNPANEEVQILFGKKELHDVQLTNTLGEMLEQTQINSSSLTLDISSKPRGIYFVTVTDEQGNKVVRKIVKM